MSSLIIQVIAAGLLLSASLIPAQQGYAGNAENGKRLYVQNGCYQCHGYVGQGGAAGARISNLPLSAQAVISYVRHPAGQMPPYTEKVMSDNELTDVWAYIKTFPAPKAAKDIPLLNDSHSK